MSAFRGRFHFAAVSKWGVALAALFLSCVLIATSASAAKPEVVLRLANAVDDDHPYNVAAREFAELVGERTEGRVEIQLYPNGQLGAGEREEVEALQFGAIDIVITGTAVLANFLPDFQVMDLPFLFSDYDHVDAVLDGPVGDELISRLNSANLNMVGLALWEQGFRHLTNGRHPVREPEDLQGLKIRVQENPIHVDSFNSVGASSTPMSWGEVYTALQQGVIDGQENPIPVVTSHRIYEVQDYLSLTGHFYSPAIIIMNDRKFASLSPEVQEVLTRTAEEVSVTERSAARRMEEEQVAELEALGMQVVANPDKEAFREAMSGVYDEYGDQFDLIDDILAAGE